MDNTQAVYGIDLGTTYSCIAQLDKYDQPVVLESLEGESTTPSVVYFESERDIIVGKEAKSMLLVDPDNTVALVKRRMGVDADFDKSANSLPYHYDPAEISSFILKKLVNDANSQGQCEHPTTNVVITCPAYFGQKERLQTRQAGELAGLNVLAVINEPTAAAIAYGARTGDHKTVLVYDLGGGTFDVTIIRVEGNSIRVIATGGSHHLGGADWDLELAKFMLDVFNEQHSTSYTLDSPTVRHFFLNAAEEQKKRLTAKMSVRANFQFEGRPAKIEFDRELFDALTESLLEETINYTRKTIDIARQKGFDKIDEFLLVGGSSLMPQVKTRVDAEFGVDARFSDPNQCVAKGAALFAKYKMDLGDGAPEDPTVPISRQAPSAMPESTLHVVNVTSKTYGTDQDDHKVRNMIFANTTLPVSRTVTFYTASDNQRNVSMKVYESDFTDPTTDSLVDDRFCTLIDDHRLPLTKQWPKGTPVEVTFSIDQEGVLSVTAYVEHDRIDFTLHINGVRTRKEIETKRSEFDKFNID